MTGGGSGGHITPLLSLALALKGLNPAAKVIYIGLKTEKVKGLESRYRIFDEVHYIRSGKFRRYHGQNILVRITDIKTLALNILDFFKVWAGIFRAIKILQLVKPDVVFSKGGFVAVPVGIAAKLLKIPIVTHDSDIIPGLANRIIGRWAKVHATGMPPENYNYPAGTMRYTGIPVDERLEPITETLKNNYKKQIGISPDEVLLLVGGAGLGSRDVNSLVLKIASQLLNKIKKLRIIHITGEAHKKAVSEAYGQLLSEDQIQNIEVLGFSDDFFKYTGAADLIISRAGATIIAELAIQRKAAVLIPAPFLTGGHQVKNAQLLKNIRAAEIVDNDVTPDTLLNTVSILLTDNQKRSMFENNIASISMPNAAKNLADVLLQLSENNKAQG